MSAPDLSVVVLSWNTKHLTKACLEALAADPSKYQREIIVVDNASGDGSVEVLAEIDGIVLVRNSENQGYAQGNNTGAQHATGRYLCLLNSDTEVRPGALDKLVDFLESHPNHGGVAPKLVDPDGTVQDACMRFPGLVTALCYDSTFGKFWPGTWVERHYYMKDFDHLESRDVPQPPGACFMMKRDEYLAMGGLDPEMFLFFNDVDLCRRLWKKKRRIHYLAEAEVLHHRGASTGKYQGFVVTWFRNRIAYYRKHYGPLAVPYMYLILRLRAFEESLKAKKRHDNPDDVRSERAFIKQCIKEIMAP